MARSTVITLLAVGLLVAIVALPGCGRRDERSTEEGTVGSTGEMGQSGGVGTDVGDTPPAFSLADLDGNQVTLEDYAGSVVVLDLWATWCPPCRQEIPFLVSLYEEHKDAGLVVVGIGLDVQGEEILRPFVERNGVTYPILVGNREIGMAYGARSIPTTLILNREGRVAAKHVGFNAAIGDQMRQEVVRLLGGTGEEV
jgi:peroxiredoxin